MDNQFLKAQKIMVEVSPTHPLIKLMNALDWVDLEKLILPDLKKSTSKLKWWLGRKLKVRIHLGVFLLQQLLNVTDRRMGGNFVGRWFMPYFAGRPLSTTGIYLTIRRHLTVRASCRHLKHFLLFLTLRCYLFEKFIKIENIEVLQ